MAPGTMTTNKSFYRFLCIILIILASERGVAATTSNWVIAAEKFSYKKSQSQNAVTDAVSETIPVSILEKFSQNLERNVLPDERYSREEYNSRKERQSLYLQLSSAYKKRDALFLQNLSESELKRKTRDEEKEIKKIQDKIVSNLENIKKSRAESEKDMLEVSDDMIDNIDDDSEFIRVKTLFKRIFVKEKNIITREDIKLYQGDNTRLFTASEKAKNTGYQSPTFESEVSKAKINTLITGTITAYGEYISVAVEIYMYPGCKKIASLMEVGSMGELDFIASSLSSQMLPLFTNALPVNLQIAINPPEAAKNATFYIDDVLQTSKAENIVLNSGPHTLEFISEGYRTASTTYGFEGNQNYKIEINFEPKKDGFIQIGLVKSISGDIFANGELAQKVDDRKSQIVINGNQVLGEFIAENGESAFYYIPKKLYFDGSYVKINPKVRNREDYINNRRRWFYASYTMLIVSLIPTFYTTGQLETQAGLYKDGNTSFDEAKRWQDTKNICAGISIGCGVFMAYELVRYLLAANSVLPQTVSAGNLNEYEYYDFSKAREAEEPAGEEVSKSENKE